MNNRFAIIYSVVLAVLAIVASILGFREIRFDDTSLAQVGVLFATLALVAIVIERAVEVYVARRYDPDKVRIQRPLVRAKTKLEKVEKLLADERDRRQTLSRAPTTEEKEDLQKLIDVADEARDEFEKIEEQVWHPLSKVRSNKLRAASVLSLFFGALAAFSGVRVLGQFLPEKVLEVGEGFAQVFQLGAFRATDTVLTALLLAGGADGIHKILSSFKSFRSNAAS